MRELYYRFWAQMRGIDPPARTLIVAAVAALLCFLVARLTYRIWKGAWLRMLLWGCGLWFLLISDFYYDGRIRRSHGGQSREIRIRQNQFAESCSSRYRAIEEKWTRVKEKKKKLSPAWGILAYALLCLCILIPEPALARVPLLGDLAGMYDNAQRCALATAKSYQPFWEWPPEGEPAFGREDEQTAQTEEDKWLHLNKKGKGGANVRREPDGKSEVIDVVEGDSRFKKLEESESGNWLKIELEDGTVGWVHNSLVEEE